MEISFTSPRLAMTFWLPVVGLVLPVKVMNGKKALRSCGSYQQTQKCYAFEAQKCFIYLKTLIEL